MTELQATKPVSPGWARFLPVAAPRLLVLAVVGALVLGALPHVNALGRGFIPVIQALLPVVCLAVLALAVGLMIFRRTRLPGLIILVGALAGGAPTLVPATPSGGTGAGQLTILSLNAGVGNADATELSAMILEEQADLVVLVETDENLIEKLLFLGVRAELPFRSRTVSPGGVSGSVILSRYDLVQEGDISAHEGAAVFDQPVVRLEHPQLGALRVAAIHPFPPISGAVDWKDGLATIDEWQNQTSDLPLILAGDFNASYAYPQFRKLASSFASTAAAHGQFPVPTWPATGKIPAFTAIDHVLVRGLTPTAWERVSVSQTDHFGILARVTHSGGK